jgi:DNA-binding CsgD family transcriptional regulator
MRDFGRRHPSTRVAEVASGDLERGRACCEQHAWADAYRSLSRADRAAALGGDDLELLATSAYLVGRDDEYLNALDRAHHGHLSAGKGAGAARCAFWLGLRLLFRGETGRATGWLARARRLLEREECDRVERGYLLLPEVERHLAAGDFDAAYTTATDAAAIGGRFADADLIACARHQQGRARMRQGRLEEGLALLDETMVSVTEGELSPIMTGLIYCSVIESCREVYALDRACEWIAALGRWCAAQPEMVAFSGVCRVHRAEIMQWRGAWRDAMEEARRGCQHCRGVNRQAAAAAFYQRAELHRLRGEFAAAEKAYQVANRWGWEPQPGLALLRVAQGHTDAAAAAIHRAVGAVADRLQRARLLPAHVEIMLATGDIQEACCACRELEETAERFDSDVLGAMAAQARGAVDLAEGNARAALRPLRRAWRVWQRVEAPYLTARVRVLAGLACRALGDSEGAKLDLDAARAVFEQLGAAPDVARIDSLTKGAPSSHSSGLSPRELQVLRLIAAGKTNKAIAAELFLSVKTIDRHVSNIFTKLDVPSRAAATAYAYEHKLI